MFLKNLLTLFYKRLVRKERQIWTLRKSEDEFDVKTTYAYDYEEQSIFVFEEILKMKENLLELEQERSPFFS
jgi:superfamily I DNA/RNA helicase